MGMDRNTIIGFVLIGALLIGMFALNSKDRLEYEAQQKKIADSIAAVQAKKNKVPTNVIPNKDSIVEVVKNIGAFKTSEKEKTDTIENEVLKIVFTNKGAQPLTVELKKFKKYDQKLVVLRKGSFNRFGYRIKSGENQTTLTDNLIFKPEPVVVNKDGSKTLIFIAADSSNQHRIIHQYTIRPKDYMIDFEIKMDGADQLLSANTIHFDWYTELPQIEKDHKYESSQTHFCYLKDNSFDFNYLGSGDRVELKEKVEWLSAKQQFFTSTLIGKNKFNDVVTKWEVPKDTNGQYIAQFQTSGQYAFQPGRNISLPLQLYFGPTDYNILKSYGNQQENIVPYGTGIFSFVKYINRHLLLPVFDFFQKYISSMGIVILLLTLFIRLLTSPILYKSYLSGAKMKVLKPEVDALREKFKDDQQAFGMEQMKLWRSAGVNPLGGCLPALLQIPIFMSLYYFFQSNIDLRGKSFLWASDLASYDSILNFSFNIPFYGNHISLFTLTAVLTSLLISIYSMSNMQGNTNPMMKYMPYIFPVLLLGVFNGLPAALTWYYTISNTITLILQIVIQKYIIDHDKIMAQINENRKKPVKKSKIQERIEAMQESQRKLQDLKNKSNKK
ncbi:MAG: membrane protein insertase YidC [Ferruginibacter sp.]|nr:membrane protein insertase YidC [Ferruginibacter sp.]